MLIVLATVSSLVVGHRSFAGLVCYLAGGLGAGLGAAIVSARPPSPVWKRAVLCLSAAYVPCAVVMLLLGLPPAYALGYALVPTVLYGSAAILFAADPSLCST